MKSILLQIWATLMVAYKRLLTQRSLALATVVGLTTSVALVLSVPLYADATQFRLLRQQIVGERGPADYAPLQFLYHFDGIVHSGPQWEDSRSVDQYLSQSVGPSLGLPTLQLVRRFRTDSLQLFPPLDPANPQTQYFITWAHFGFVSQPEKNVRLVRGAFPVVADLSPSAPLEVLVHEGAAAAYAIVPGDIFYARRDNLEIPVRVAGIWAPADPTLPVWDVGSDEAMLLVPEDTYVSRIATVLPDELLAADWLVVLSGSNLHASDIAGLLKRAAAVTGKAAALLPGTQLAASPTAALASYQKAAPALTLLLYAFSAPILGLILLFMGLVSGLFVNEQRNEIAILRSRGATVFQVGAMTALQGVTLGGVALVFGIPLGLIIAHAIGRSRSFMDFTTPTKLRVVLTPQILGFGLLAVAAVLLFQFIVPTLSAARNTIVTYKQERARSLQAPWWQRVWLDLVLLIPAAYGAYWLYNQRVLVAAHKLQVPDPLQNPQLILVPSLGIFALTLLMLRVMPAFMAALAGVMAGTRSVGLLMASRYLSRTPAFYSAPLMLLVFTLSLSAFTASIAQTLDHHLDKEVSYATGADLALQEYGTTYNSSDSSNPTYTFVPVTEYLHLQDVRAATWVGRYSSTILKADGSSQEANFLGIDRLSFPQVAYWQPNFARARLGSLMNALGQYPDGVLVSRDFLDEQGLHLGDTLLVGVRGRGWTAGLRTTIVGIIDLFPSWYPEKGPLCVGNIDYLFEQAGNEYPHEVWLKTDPAADPESLVYAVRGYSIALDLYADQSRLVKNGLNTFVTGWTSASQSRTSEQQRPERQGLFGLLSVGFVTAALLTVLGFILYALFSFRRRFIELGMLRAVGLSASQMAALLASELIFLVLIGLGVGTGLGVLFSRWFIPYLQVGASLSAHYPPFLVEVAWASIAQMYVLFGLLFLGALSILTALLLRMKIFQAIKLGETT